VHFGGDKIQPLLHAVTVDRASGRHEARVGFLVGKILHDDWAFGQLLTVIDLQHRNLALGIDAPKVLAAFGLFLRDIGPLELEIDAGLAGNNVRRKRTCARRIIKVS
jgi:hypothetical protein